jgi:FkbM family methyltransferase
MNRWAEYASGITKILGSVVGLDISRYRPAAPRRQKLLELHRVEVVLDVGAHVGEYAIELRSGGFTGTIVSFEPTHDHFRVLSSKAAEDPDWTAEKMALSDVDEEAQLAVAGRYTSLLPARSSLVEMFHGARPTTFENVVVRRLDGLSLYTSCLAKPTLLKMDVQGNELRVLRGAGKVLGQIPLVEAELSIVEFYDGQASFYEVLRHLDDHGFTLVDLEPITRDNKTGKLAQANGIFVRRDLR